MTFWLRILSGILPLFLSISVTANALTPQPVQTEKPKKSQAVVVKPSVLQSNLSAQQQKIVNNQRLQILKNPKKLLQFVKVSPAFKEGKMQGLKLRPGKNKKIFNALGFKSRDIVTKINGIIANRADKFDKIRHLIYNNKTFDLRLRRNRRDIRLFIKL